MRVGSAFAVLGRDYRMSVWITAAACMLLLGGCVASEGAYYTPTATDGKIVGNACGGLAGPPNTLQLERGNSKISVTPPNSENDRFLAVRIKVHTGDVISMDLGQVRLLGDDLRSLLKEQNLYIFDWKNNKFVKLQSTAELAGDRLVSSDQGFSEYEIAIEFDENPPNAFTLTIPNLASNGIQFSGLTIKFVKSQGRWVSPINC